jgi:hypothetical protein
MHPSLVFWGRGAPAALILFVCACCSLRLSAYPPAPYYTIFGVVRDQVGATLNVDGAELKLLRDGVEVGRASIQTGLRLDQNYELKIRLDQARSGTRTYSSNAIVAQGVFSLVVTLNGQTFFPIEARGTLRVGDGGERVRLDLSLGVDANNDGLPDAWQEWVLYQAGRLPGTAAWNINLVTKDGDFDGDGTSNFLEYLAGTFAGDATERFELRLTTKTATLVGFEYYAITGKVYGIEESTNLSTWTAAAFSTTAGGTTANLSRAPASGVTSAFVAVQPGASRFYRLTVR